METTTAAPPGLRERKKAATRRALHEAAVRLTAEHGLDQVTVEAIADAAGVSRRTFSNYFENKEDALLYGHIEWRCRLSDRFAARPDGEPAWTALRTAAHEVFADFSLHPGLLRQIQLAHCNPSLNQGQVARFAELELELAALIAARDGLPADGIRARVLAAAFLTAVRVGAQRWADEHPGRSLIALVNEALDEVGRPFV
ncbi:TetR/AcrR family transcriptional regulator [Actinomadura rayongensis]|uniref:TetR family transcriptional regulator n=1 Tax=Actinomadura rayongensis TaxID=1429076 RepID=A0A6I4WCH9_9ACTN|nr:TetR/AcrR family transcriptional regulator [Actinomadura rayongensis]MXQ66813.1 TetR family transcriptional regulator [Actinomadura rayongensis]